jgi:hypothetical protein
MPTSRLPGFACLRERVRSSCKTACQLPSADQQTNLDQFACGLGGSRARPTARYPMLLITAYVSGGSSSGSAHMWWHRAGGLCLRYRHRRLSPGACRAEYCGHQAVQRPCQHTRRASAAQSVDCISVLRATSMACTSAWGVLSAPDARDAYSRPLELNAQQQAQASGLAMPSGTGFWRRDGWKRLLTVMAWNGCGFGRRTGCH